MATLLSAAALLTIREDNALFVIALGALGALGLFHAPRRSTGAALIGLGLACLLLWRYVGVRMLGGEQLPAVLAGTYASWGDTPGEIVRNILSRPLDVIRHLIAPVPIQYLVLLLAPVLGILPFGSALLLVALPQIAMILLAGHDSRMFQIRMHYSVAPAVVLMFAAVATLRRFDAAGGGPAPLVRTWAPRAMLAIGLLLLPGWAMRAGARLNPYRSQIRQVLAVIPDTASVTAPGYLINALAARRHIGLAWSEALPATSYLVLEDSSRFFLKSTTVDAFHTPRFDSLLLAGGYERVLQRDGWHVYRRR
jgi:hypothetical protein